MGDFASFMMVKDSGIDMITQFPQALESSKLTMEKFFHIMKNFGTFAQKYGVKKRSHEMIINYTDESDFVDQMAIAFSRVKRVKLEAASKAVRLVDEAIDRLVQNK